MSAHDATVPLKHMRDAALRAVEIARPLTRDHLSADDVVTLALTRLVEIVGEASRRVPEDVRARYPDIPWQQIAGARNRLIHGYDSVDLDILWRIAISSRSSRSASRACWVAWADPTEMPPRPPLGSVRWGPEALSSGSCPRCTTGPSSP